MRFGCCGVAGAGRYITRTEQLPYVLFMIQKKCFILFRTPCFILDDLMNNRFEIRYMEYSPADCFPFHHHIPELISLHRADEKGFIGHNDRIEMLVFTVVIYRTHHLGRIQA